ncbi:hypothetical protein DSO57_1033756 [Entomophthora muscae]|uniref:Uncharacterized protein n=1 Tax=Entomophthora muscae TaxID=34485 RepID=A0ACC2TM43_9FUNG|nr:hypothetical protein DSO57_1033756 [Entomophthora muscae]
MPLLLFKAQIPRYFVFGVADVKDSKTLLSILRSSFGASQGIADINHFYRPFIPQLNAIYSKPSSNGLVSFFQVDCFDTPGDLAKCQFLVYLINNYFNRSARGILFHQSFVMKVGSTSILSLLAAENVNQESVRYEAIKFLQKFKVLLYLFTNQSLKWKT